MITYSPAPEKVLELAKQLIREYHPELRDANIAIVIRDDEYVRNGKWVLGQARKFPRVYRTATNCEYDFLIWLDKNLLSVSEHMLTPVLDHELTHCWMDIDGSVKIRAHDVEEFTCIIERYGDYEPGLIDFHQAMDNYQSGLFEPTGTVATITLPGNNPAKELEDMYERYQESKL